MLKQEVHLGANAKYTAHTLFRINDNCSSYRNSRHEIVRIVTSFLGPHTYSNRLGFRTSPRSVMHKIYDSVTFSIKPVESDTWR